MIISYKNDLVYVNGFHRNIHFKIYLEDPYQTNIKIDYDMSRNEMVSLEDIKDVLLAKNDGIFISVATHTLETSNTSPKTINHVIKGEFINEGSNLIQVSEKIEYFDKSGVKYGDLVMTKYRNHILVDLVGTDLKNALIAKGVVENILNNNLISEDNVIEDFDIFMKFPIEDEMVIFRLENDKLVPITNKYIDEAIDILRVRNKNFTKIILDHIKEHSR